MVRIYHENYHRKCRIFVRFRFLCSNFDVHLKGQGFKAPKSCYVEQIFNFLESLKPKKPGIRKVLILYG